MVNSEQIKDALQAHEAESSRKITPRQLAERNNRIHILREKINDDGYLENALEKLASDLARILY